MGLVESRDCQDMGCMPGVYVVGEVSRTGARASKKSVGVNVLTSSHRSQRASGLERMTELALVVRAKNRDRRGYMCFFVGKSREAFR